MKKPVTPFPTAGYYGPDYFCNRQVETTTLLQNVQGGLSTTLTAIRRMGKTGLIMHTRQYLPAPWKMIYLDILYTEDRMQMVNVLTNAVAQAIPEKKAAGKKIWQYIRSLRPVISYDHLSGAPQLSLNLQPADVQHSLENMLALLDSYPEPIVVALDEFQQILNYPESHTDAWLRSIIQHLTNVVFIFAGSRQHLMADIFTNPSRPFYRSTQLLNLPRIEKEVYAEFIERLLARDKRRIDENTLSEILDYTCLHTYYVQLLMSRCYIRPEKRINSHTWREEAGKLLKEQQSIFFGYRDVLSKSQWRLLKAIAAEGQVSSPTAGVFLRKYDLSGSASVLRSLAALQKKELVYYDYDESGDKYYGVYDVLFQRWIQNNALL